MRSKDGCLCGSGEPADRAVSEILRDGHFDVISARLQQMLHDRRRPSAAAALVKELQAELRREQDLNRDLFNMVVSLKEITQHLAACVQQTHEAQVRLEARVKELARYTPGRGLASVVEPETPQN